VAGTARTRSVELCLRPGLRTPAAENARTDYWLAFIGCKLLDLMLSRLARFAVSELRYRKIFRKYRDFTMIPAVAYAANLRLAATVRDIPGDIIECGTWRGGMIAGIADVLGAGRHYRLFDSYEGMPPAQEIDGPLALAWEKNISDPKYHNNCRASELEAKHAMSRSAAKSFVITKGWLRETLPKAERKPIALLRLDADWYDSTVCILENFASSVVRGGLIIVDDYYLFEGCTRAVNEYVLARNWMIHQSRFGEVCYVVV
jgi:O-methyltransferase